MPTSLWLLTRHLFLVCAAYDIYETTDIRRFTGHRRTDTRNLNGNPVAGYWKLFRDFSWLRKTYFKQFENSDIFDLQKTKSQKSETVDPTQKQSLKIVLKSYEKVLKKVIKKSNNQNDDDAESRKSSHGNTTPV